jgi:hypothetical protein
MPQYSWNTAKVGFKRQSINQYSAITPRYRWNTAKVGTKHQSINQYSVITPRYRWNTAKVGTKHQSINQYSDITPRYRWNTAKVGTKHQINQSIQCSSNRLISGWLIVLAFTYLPHRNQTFPCHFMFKNVRI